MLHSVTLKLNNYRISLKFAKILASSLRWSSSNVSYYHQPGSEPLRYATVGDTILETVDRWPGRVAVRSVHQDQSLTFSELWRKAEALSYGLIASGLTRGDRLGVWAHNCTEWILTLVAAVRVGIIPVALNPIYEIPELSYCIKKVGMKGLLLGESIKGRQYCSTIKNMIPESITSKTGYLNSNTFPDLKILISCGNEKLPGMFNFNSLIEEFKRPSQSRTLENCNDVNPDDGCIIHFTSGTTGNPKAALDSHFGIVNNTYDIGKRNTLHEHHHSICVQVPIFHAFGTVITVFTALRHGSTLVLPSANYNARANYEAIRSENCTAVYGTPTMFVDLVSETRSQTCPTSLKIVLTAGAPCSPKLFQDIKEYLKPQAIKSLFGMTETTAAIFQSLPDETMEQVTETVGCVQEHIEVKVVDDNNKTVPFGHPGELLVRGYNTMMCYWDDEEKTRETMGPDRWLRTGDKFILQEDGYGKIVGRLKDIVVKGGENIAPKEIEDVLNTHPEIIESQVIGVADDRLGEELCAVVRLRSRNSFSIEDINKHCTGKISKFKIPRLLRIIENYPKTASGKIQKYKLREMVESGKL